MRMVRRVNSTSNGCAHARAEEARLHPRARAALEARRDLRGGPAARRRRVDADDPVPLADARLLGRRVGIDLADHDRAFVILDQHADATVEAAGGAC